MDLVNVTITGNTADNDNDGIGGAGGLYSDSSASSTSLLNTIISDNIDKSGYAADCNDSSLNANIVSNDYDLISDLTNCILTGTTTHNVTGVSANLGPLAANSGTTFTHALLAGSPAIDAGTSASAPVVDQRGLPRPFGAAFDIGAYELESVQPPPPSPPPPQVPPPPPAPANANGGGSAGIYQMFGNNPEIGKNPAPPAAPNLPPSTQELHGAPQTQEHWVARQAPILQNFFNDTLSHWAKSEVDDVLNNCKVAGYQDAGGNFERVFKPDQQVTRAELFTMIMKCKYGPLPPPQVAPFPDVPADHWAAPYVAKGVEIGLIQGYNDGTFQPNQPITRAEALKAILLSQFTSQVIDASSQNSLCADVSNEAWYAKFFFFALNMHIVGQGSNAGTCNPANNMTRAESAVSVDRAKNASTVITDGMTPAT